MKQGKPDIPPFGSQEGKRGPVSSHAVPPLLAECAKHHIIKTFSLGLLQGMRLSKRNLSSPGTFVQKQT